MAASFGEQLRLAREARGITLRHISDQTRISVRYLEAIEGDDYKRLPGGIFNRSFIKSYAKQIGFDEKEAIEGYLRTAREQGESDEVSTTPYKSHVYTDGGSRSPIVTLLLTILILAILSLGVYAAVHWYQRRESNRNNNESPPATNPPATQATNPNTGSTGSTAQTPLTTGFNIEIKARGEDIWTRIYEDDGKGQAIVLRADETREFKPDQRLRIQLAKGKTDLVEVRIGGRLARMPAEPKGNLAEVVITKDDYERFLQ